MSGTVGIIQARMGSTRLAGKSLLTVGGKPLLQRVVERTRLCRSIDSVVVATTHFPEDKEIAERASSYGANVFIGDVMW